ncbi:MAG: hypothetical protein N0C84_23835 [Candidatus Thiodiazotropha taylori]|uniref:Uncharacterized protein n=1 Tax=Candidatus Thiodiazotropha taylori TaxID=2792791 RepID=A0A9E4N8E5_9GAMM|nr:hypothetical protein [Candidatus Thiodiazotropha taylori]MCW4259501.1 hypothetical protein [Candidatus Thiodiazotropha taylori]
MACVSYQLVSLQLTMPAGIDSLSAVSKPDWYNTLLCRFLWQTCELIHVKTAIPMPGMAWWRYPFVFYGKKLNVSKPIQTKNMTNCRANPWGD